MNTKRTGVTHQPASLKQNVKPTGTVKIQRLEAVNKFTYLGSTLSRTAQVDDEVNIRIAKASVTFGKQRKTV